MEFLDFGADLGNRGLGGTHGRKCGLVPLICDASFEPGDNPKSALLGLAGDVLRTFPRLHLREALLLLGFGRLALLTVSEGIQFTLRRIGGFACCCGFPCVSVTFAGQSLNAGATPVPRLLLLLPLLARLVLCTFKVCVVLIFKIEVIVEGVEIVATVEGQVVRVHVLLLASNAGKSEPLAMSA